MLELIIQSHAETLHYQTGVEFILLSQYDLWGVRHDVKVDLIILPGRNIRFL